MLASSRLNPQESQRRMADIIDFLPDATLVIDRDGRVIAWNRAIEEMTGVKAADMVGRGNYEYALPFYAERRPILIDLVLLPDEEIKARYISLRRNGAALSGETPVSSLRGHTAYLYATASALRNSKGDVVGAIETIRDITDRKRAEEELREAKAAAESATQAKSAFLATMSHEIRTPMNAVIGMTSLLLSTAPVCQSSASSRRRCRPSGDALLTVINDILDFSRSRHTASISSASRSTCESAWRARWAWLPARLPPRVSSWAAGSIRQCRPASWAMRRAFAKSCSTSSAMPASSPRRVRS